MSTNELVELRRLVDEVTAKVQKMLKETWRAPGATPSNYDWQKDARELLKLLVGKDDKQIPVRGSRRTKRGNKMERFANRNR